MNKKPTVLVVGKEGNTEAFTKALQELTKVAEVCCVAAEELVAAVSKLQSPDRDFSRLKALGCIHADRNLNLKLCHKSSKPYAQFINKPIGQQRRRKKV